MEDISYFYKFLDTSDISLLGYRFKYERIKDEIISKISYYEIKKIDSSFSFKQFIRNQKLDELLNGNSSKQANYLILDLGNLNFLNNGLSRKKQIDDIIEILRKQMYSDDVQNFKLLILSPTLCNSAKENIDSFTSGNSPIYISDFVTVIHEDSLEIIKNRFEHNVNKISLRNLKDYVQALETSK
jgi:hypothetical protein